MPNAEGSSNSTLHEESNAAVMEKTANTGSAPGTRAALLPKPASSYNLRRTIWRPYITPFEEIINYEYEGSGTPEDPYIVDWLPKDREDPQTWPTVYKWISIAVAAIGTMAIALSSSAYAGGVVSIMKEFGASRELCIAGVSLFVVGFAFGPLFWAPCSEVWGRRKIFVITYLFLTLWQSVTCASQNIESILVFRFLAGFFGSSPLANAGGTISDVLDANQRGLGMALFSAAPFLGPALGPITGGFLGEKAGWRWIEGYLGILSAVMTALVALFAAETYAPYLLRRRATLLSKVTGKEYRFRADVKKPLDIITLFKVSLIRPWKFLVYEPIVIILSIYTAVIYGILYLNFAAYPIVFQGYRGWSQGIGGLAFLGILVGTFCAIGLSIFYVNPSYVKTAKKRGGRATPEDRLPSAIWGGVLIVIGLAGFAATDGPDVHWIAPIIFGVPFGTGVIVVFLAVLGYLVDSYTIYAASVLAANSVLRSLFGAAFPLFTTQMYSKLGIHWAAALPGFLALACVPLTWIFYKYGAQIRARCKYASDAERQMNAIIAARMAARQQAMAAQTEEGKIESAGNKAARSGSDATAAGTDTASKNDAAIEAEAREEPANMVPAPSSPTAEKRGRGFAGGAALRQITSTTSVGPYDNELTTVNSAAPEDFEMYKALAERDAVDPNDDEEVERLARQAHAAHLARVQSGRSARSVRSGRSGHFGHAGHAAQAGQAGHSAEVGQSGTAGQASEVTHAGQTASGHIAGTISRPLGAEI